jgi:hypothetical protein
MNNGSDYRGLRDAIAIWAILSALAAGWIAAICLGVDR